jgi:hypothetical protein
LSFAADSTIARDYGTAYVPALRAPVKDAFAGTVCRTPKLYCVTAAVHVTLVPEAGGARKPVIPDRSGKLRLVAPFW